MQMETKRDREGDNGKAKSEEGDIYLGCRLLHMGRI